MNYIKNYSITFNASSLEFQSTPSVGRATPLFINRESDKLISIHALRGEGDLFLVHIYTPFQYFNPRPPWGGRLRQISKPEGTTIISIHALRGEGDDTLIMLSIRLSISIHALRGEGDRRIQIALEF